MANDLDNLINFLRLSRRSEEANKNNNSDNIVNATIMDTEESVVIDRTAFENFTNYKRIFGELAHYLAKDIYVKNSTNEKKYYIKIDDTNSNGSNYLNLENNSSEQVNENELYAFPIYFDYTNYFFDIINKNVLIVSRNLDTVYLFNDIIEYDPKKIEIVTGQYIYAFEDHVSTFNTLAEPLVKPGLFSLLETAYRTETNLSDRLVTVNKSTASGSMNLIPKIRKKGDNYVLDYIYSKSEKKRFYEKSLEQQALSIEFKCQGAFITFLNETIFNDPDFDYDDTSRSEKRTNFINSFHELIVAPLEKNIADKSELHFIDAMATIHYLSNKVLITLSNDSYWILFEEVIKRDSLSNKKNLNEEDIFVKIVGLLAKKEPNKDLFLERLLNKVAVKENILSTKATKEISYFEFLYDRINGDNFIAFVNIMHSVWLSSKYMIPAKEVFPELQKYGPFLLPYQSEKIIGFYVSNVDASFSNNDIHIDFDTGKEEWGPNIYAKSGEGYNPVIEHYIYHPYFPIFVTDVEKQKTELKFDTIIPAFFIKANDDKQFWHNVIKTGEYTADVLTILSGIGNLTKFRYLTELASLAEGVETANAIAKTANILRYVKGAAGVVELTSGSVNLMLKLSGLDETELGQSLSKILFYLELITLAGELTFSMKKGLRESAKEAIEASDGSLRIKHPKLFAELYKIAEIDALYKHIDNFIQLRPKFQNLELVNNLWKEKITSKLLFPNELRRLYFKYLDEFPNLKKGFNQAEFKTIIYNNGKKIEEIAEFSISGDKNKLLAAFGDPPVLPENIIDILDDYDNFEAFVKGTSDFLGQPRSYDSELKYIFNFLKNHINKGDEFIIETKNIFKTCGSCRRELVMLEYYLKKQGKKVKFVVISDEAIEGTRKLKDKLKIN